VWLFLFGEFFRGQQRIYCPLRGIGEKPSPSGEDHVHLFVSVPPQWSISKVMGRIKGKTSRKLLSESRRFAKEFWGRHLWARGYFAASSGNVTDEVIMQYIATQDLEERARDGDFTLAP
jgi:putative transposase